MGSGRLGGGVEVDGGAGGGDGGGFRVHILCRGVCALWVGGCAGGRERRSGWLRGRGGCGGGCFGRGVSYLVCDSDAGMGGEEWEDMGLIAGDSRSKECEGDADDYDGAFDG